MPVQTQRTDPDAAADELERLRSELDALDRSLLAAVRDRIRLCVRIAEIKRAHRMPMMQPRRIAIVKDRAAAFAVDHGIDREFLTHLYDLIIEETCRIEDLVIAGEA